MAGRIPTHPAIPVGRRTLIGAGAAVAATTALAVSRSSAASPGSGSFGAVSDGRYLTVDTGAGLVFQLSLANGDMTSLRYQGTELTARSRPSNVESGLGNGASVTAGQVNGCIVVTESTRTFYGHGTLHHYLVVRPGRNSITMATYVDAAAAGELRWIQSIDRSVLSDIWQPSDVRGGTVIESKDIFRVGAQTRSKYYSNRRALELTIRGVTGRLPGGGGVGVFMEYGNRESSAGGPFFRDIEQQGTDDSIQLYNYLWSAHNQTEPQRLGVLYGPYALHVTDGTAPAPSDFSFVYGLGLQGAVGPGGRGAVSGHAGGVPAGTPALVGFANGQAQYWADVAADGSFTCAGMKPGTYTQTLYRNELAVSTRQVTVAAGRTTAGQDIASTWPTTPAVFRIGDWDGTPSGFRNWAYLTGMHPSDARMGGWPPATFTVGRSPQSAFPAYQWKDVNDPTTILFPLAAGQIADRTLRVGVTAAFAGGRPQATVNSWTSPVPPPSVQPSSRSLTIGTYRGNNTVFAYHVPVSALHVGMNTLRLSIVSGSGGSGYLSPGVSYDCVELL